MLPAARPRICSLLRQTAGEGPRVVGQTLASAQSHPPEPPHWAPTALRPRSPSSAKPTELEGFRTAAECDTPSRGGVVVALPCGPRGNGERTISDADRRPGTSSRRFREAARGCSQNCSLQYLPANGLQPAPPVPGHTSAGPGAGTLSCTVNSPQSLHSRSWGGTAAS